MPSILRTPAPYPSTVLSLSEGERFRHHNAQIQAITITPSHVILSGPHLSTQELQTYELDAYQALAATAARPAVHTALTDELQAGPAPSLTPAPARQRQQSARARAAAKGIRSV